MAGYLLATVVTLLLGPFVYSSFHSLVWISLTFHMEFTIFSCWVPRHIGIPGNEQVVDDLAKLAMNLDMSEEPILFSELKTSVNEYITNVWQERWSLLFESSLNRLKFY